MHAIFDLQRATLRARERGHDVATRAERGLVQLVRVDYDSRGRSVIQPLSEWMPPEAAVTALDTL
jgi:hypothetical protein